MCAVNSDGIFYTAGRGSHLGTRNDLTMSTLDDLMSSLKAGTFFPEVTFHLLDEHGASQEWHGLYTITDNGFHKWRICQFPDTATRLNNGACGRGRSLESVRKDVECAFGRLKARFRVIDVGPRVQHVVF